MILYFKNHIAQKWLLIFLAIFFVLSALLAGAFLIFEKKYAHKFYPGTYIANIDVSGLSAEQTKNLLNNKVNLINQNGIKFQYRENSAILFPLIASIETDLAYEIINFDIEKSINEINKFGRGNSFFNNLKEKLGGIKSSLGNVLERQDKNNSDKIEQIEPAVDETKDELLKESKKQKSKKAKSESVGIGKKAKALLLLFLQFLLRVMI